MRPPILSTLCLAAGLWLALPLATLGAPESTAELVAVLESDASVQEKAIACRKLGELGTAEAVPALAGLLQHEVLGTYARQGLERLPAPSASAALRSALETTEGELLAGVITSLGALRDEKAVGPLGELAGHDDASVRRAALLALGRVATPEAIRRAKAALASGQEGAASACLLAAERQRAQGQTDAAIALYEAVRAADVPEAARLGATRGAIITRRSVPFLVEHLKSDDAAIRDVALLTIREMPSSELADALHTQLASAAPDLRLRLIVALRDCHNDDSFGVVRTQLDSDAPALRMAALGTLSAVGRGPELAGTLLDVVQERRSPEEKQVAVELLTRMEGGEPVDAVILDRLRQTEAVNVRIDVIRILGNRRAASATGELLEQARDEEPRVRAAALRSMRRLVGPEDVAPLIDLVEAERDDPGRTAAVSALVSACGDDGPSGALVLAELEQASDAAERDVWIRVLTATGYPGALPVILEDLKSDDEEVVARTVTHLSRWPDPSPIEPLLPLMGNDPDSEVQRRAVSAVIQLTTTAADREQRPDDVLVGWFGGANSAVVTVQEKRQLLSGLGRVHTPASLRLAEPYLQDPEVETEAVYALLSIGSPLVKAGHADAVARALPADSAIGDQELRWRVSRLREQAAAAAVPPR